MIRNGFTNLKKFQTARRPGDRWQGVRKGLSSQILPGFRSAPPLHATYEDAMRGRGTGGFPGTRFPGAAPAANPAPAPPASPAAAGPASSELPPDSLYLMGLSQNQKVHDQTVAGLRGHQQSTALDYGVDFKRGADGGLQSYGISNNVDVTNPFSKAALLKQSFQNSTRGNTTSMAAGGQLYSGALQNAQNETGRQNAQGIDALLKNFAALYGEDEAGVTAAGSELGGANLTAYGDLLGRKEQVAPAGPEPINFENLARLIAAGKKKGTSAPRVVSSVRQPSGKVTGKKKTRLINAKVPRVIR